jgi:hypothetical protein
MSASYFSEFYELYIFDLVIEMHSSKQNIVLAIVLLFNSIFEDISYILNAFIFYFYLFLIKRKVLEVKSSLYL